jgi:two-component system sensor histidine kinase TctE
MAIDSGSLRASLIRRLATALVAVAVVGTVVAYQLGSRLGNQAYDRAQVDDVATLADQVTLESSQVQVNLPTAALKWLLADEGEMVLFRVTDLRTGRVVDTNGDLGPMRPPPGQGTAAGFRDIEVRNKRMRVAYKRFAIEPGAVPILVEIGETMGKRNQMTDAILAGTLLLMALIGLIAIGLVWYGVGSALAPLAQLEADAEARSGADLTPLDPMHAPEEIRGLIVAINRMMERVSMVMQSQSHFIANAAHQLRTPLSGLRLQAQLGLKAQDLPSMRARLGEVESSAVRASDLVEKLLVLAKAESASLSAEHEAVDLVQVAREVIERLLPVADAHAVDLGLSAGNDPILVEGSAFLFGELLGNLIDNAILHGRQGGRVTVEIADAPEHVLLAVIDDGPGFGDADTALLFTRFYRPDSASRGGSGLGLAIVHEIAERYGGRISLDSTSNNGSRFEVYFARAHITARSHTTSIPAGNLSAES